HQVADATKYTAAQGTAQGIADGFEAVSELARQGFASGSVVYFDLEAFTPNTLTVGQDDYIENWFDTVSHAQTVDGQSYSYTPGIYYSTSNQTDIDALIAAGIIKVATPEWAARYAWKDQSPFDDGIIFPTFGSTAGYVQ